MGLRGPQKRPTKLNLIRGNPGRRPINYDEPEPAPIRPAMPELVAESEAAKKHWEYFCPILERMKVLTEADGIALGNLCMDYALLEDCQRKLRKTGPLIENKVMGYITQNPLLKIIESAAVRVARGLASFGMHPVARTAIKVSGQAKSGNPFLDLG